MLCSTAVRMSLGAFLGLNSARRSNAASMVAARSAYMVMGINEELEEAGSVALLALAADKVANAMRCLNAFRHRGDERNTHAIMARIATRHVSRDVAPRQHSDVVALEQTAGEAFTVADARPQVERCF